MWPRALRLRLPLRHWPQLACLLGSLLLSGCTPTLNVKLAQTPSLDLNGPAPDVVLIGMSGHCPPLCTAPNENYDGLADTGALDRLAEAITAAGLSVQVAGYASHAQETFQASRVGIQQRGWPSLRRDYVRLHEVWAADLPRVVMVGHSHGVPWLHQLTRQFPQYRVDALLDIDGVCELWNLDHRAALMELPPAVRGQPDIAQACQGLDTMPWQGSLRLGPKDLVPWNVERGLELHSVHGGLVPNPVDGLPLNVFWDRTPNLRPDGSRQDLKLGYSALEGHSYLSHSGSQGLAWLATELHGLALEWRAQDKRTVR